jgi:hypothetical protein
MFWARGEYADVISFLCLMGDALCSRNCDRSTADCSLGRGALGHQLGEARLLRCQRVGREELEAVEAVTVP